MKINVGQFLEAYMGAQAGRKAGQAAGMQAAQELARQKQAMDLQLEDQRMQREQFRMQQERFRQDQQDRQRQQEITDLQGQLNLTDANHPSYVQIQQRLLSKFGGGQAPAGMGTTGQFWAPATPAANPMPAQPSAPYKGTTPEAQGITPVAPVPSAPGMPQFKNPALEAQYGVITDSVDKVISLFGATDPEIAAEAERVRQQAISKAMPPAELHRSVQSLYSQAQGKGQAQTFYKSLSNQRDDLRKRLDDDQFRPEIRPEIEALLAAQPDPNDLAQMQAWTARAQKLLSANPYQKGREAKESEARAAANAANAQTQKDNQITDNLRDHATKINGVIAKGEPPSMALREIRRYNAYARANEKMGFGDGTDLDDTPRMIEVEIPVLDGDQIPAAPGPGGLVTALARGIAPGLGTRKITRQETPQEIDARMSAALADEIGKTQAGQKAHRTAAKEAFANAEKALKVAKGLDPASRDALFDRMMKYGGEAGMQVGQILRGLKIENMTPYQREQLELTKAKFEEDKRQFTEREGRFNSQFQKTYDRLSNATTKTSRLDSAQKEAAMLLRSDIASLRSERARIQQAAAKDYQTPDTTAIDQRIAAKTKEWARIVGASVTDNADGSYSVSVPEAPKVAVKEKGKPGSGDPRTAYVASLRKMNASAGGKLTEQQIQAAADKQYPRK